VKILWAVPVTNPWQEEERDVCVEYGIRRDTYGYSTVFDNFFCPNNVQKSEGLNPKIMTNQL